MIGDGRDVSTAFVTADKRELLNHTDDKVIRMELGLVYHSKSIIHDCKRLSTDLVIKRPISKPGVKVSVADSGVGDSDAERETEIKIVRKSSKPAGECDGRISSSP